MKTATRSTIRQSAYCQRAATVLECGMNAAYR